MPGAQSRGNRALERATPVYERGVTREISCPLSVPVSPLSPPAAALPSDRAVYGVSGGRFSFAESRKSPLGKEASESEGAWLSSFVLSAMDILVSVLLRYVSIAIIAIEVKRLLRIPLCITVSM